MSLFFIFYSILKYLLRNEFVGILLVKNSLDKLSIVSLLMIMITIAVMIRTMVIVHVILHPNKADKWNIECFGFGSKTFDSSVLKVVLFTGSCYVMEDEYLCTNWKYESM